MTPAVRVVDAKRYSSYDSNEPIPPPYHDEERQDLPNETDNNRYHAGVSLEVYCELTNFESIKTSGA